MHDIACPKCKGPIKWWPEDLFTARNDKRVCPSCGVSLELTNPTICCAINGLIFYALTIGLTYFGFRYGWLRFVLAGVFCWFVNPFLVRIMGKWRIPRYRGEISVKVRRWTLVSSISGWVFAVAAVATIVSFCLYYAKVITSLQDFSGNGSNGADSIEQYQVFLPRMMAGVAVAFAALVVANIAKLVRNKLQFAEQNLQVKETGP